MKKIITSFIFLWIYLCFSSSDFEIISIISLPSSTYNTPVFGDFLGRGEYQIAIVTEKGILTLIDPLKGNIIAKKQLTIKGCSSLQCININDKLYFLIGNTKGKIFVINPGDLSIVRRFNLEGPIVFPPLIVSEKKNTYLYCAKVGGEIICYKNSQKDVLWKTSIEGFISAPPSLWKDKIIISTENGKVVFVNKNTGIIEKYLSLSSNTIRNIPVKLDKLLFIEDTFGTVGFIDPEEKKIVSSSYRGKNITQYSSFSDIDKDGIVEVFRISSEGTVEIFNSKRNIFQTIYQKSLDNYGFCSDKYLYFLSPSGDFFIKNLEFQNITNYKFSRGSWKNIVVKGNFLSHKFGFMIFNDTSKGKLVIFKIPHTDFGWNGAWGTPYNIGPFDKRWQNEFSLMSTKELILKKDLVSKIKSTTEITPSMLNEYANIDSYDNFYKILSFKYFLKKYKKMLFLLLFCFLLFLLFLIFWKWNKILSYLIIFCLKRNIVSQKYDIAEKTIYSHLDKKIFSEKDKILLLNLLAKIKLKIPLNKKDISIFVPNIEAISEMYKEPLKEKIINFAIENSIYEKSLEPLVLEFLNKNSFDYNALLLLAKIYFTDGEYEKAIQYYLNTLKLAPTKGKEILKELVWALYYKGDFSIEYKEYYKKAYILDEKNFLLHWATFIIKNELFTEENIPVLEKLAEEKPQIEYLIPLAKAYFHNKRLKDTFELASIIYKSEPDNPEIVKILALVYSSFERTSIEALQVYEKAYKLGLDNEEFIKIFARSYYENNVFNKKSLPVFEKAYQLENREPWILESLVKIYYHYNQLDKAILVLEELSKYHLDKENLKLAAKIYASQKKRNDKARIIYEEAIQAGITEPEIIEMLAEIYINEKRKDKFALEVYAMYVDLHPENTLINEFLCEQLFQYEMYQEVIKYARTYLKYKSDNKKIKKILAYAEMKLNEIDEAITHYETFFKEHPDDKDAIKFLAEAYAIKEKFDEEAIKLYFKAYRFGSRNPHLIRMIALFHLKNKNVENAILVLEHLKNAKYLHSIVISDIDKYFEENGLHPDLLVLQIEFLIISNFVNKALDKITLLISEFPDKIEKSNELIEKILKMEPYNLQALQTKFMLSKYMGKYDEALEIFEHILEIEENIGKGFLEEVEEIIDEMIQKNPLDYTLRYKKGYICYLAHKYDEALKHLDRAQKNKELKQKVISLKIEIFEKMGEYDIALNLLKELPINSEIKNKIYNLCLKLEKEGLLKPAYDGFKYLFSIDEGYKDVVDRINSIKKRLTNIVSEDLEEGTIAATQIASQVNPVEERYELLEEIGRGNMGIVYKAYDKTLDEIVALKILPPDLAMKEELLERFKAEAKAARKLAHKNIIRIYDFGEEKGYKFISMEFIEGKTLKEILKEKGKLDYKEVVNYVIQIADALDYAHSLGIVHRDIKPANIMISADGTAKVADFGIAKIQGGEDLTSFGAIVGTPLYMSPEQAKGMPVDNRSDLYSLGVVIYEMLAGTPPFKGKDVIHKHLKEIPKPIEGIPEELNEIVMKLLAKDPAQRFQSAAELKNALLSIDL